MAIPFDFACMHQPLPSVVGTSLGIDEPKCNIDLNKIHVLFGGHPALDQLPKSYAVDDSLAAILNG